MEPNISQPKGGLPANQSRVGQPTTSIADVNGNQVSWDLLIESAQSIGIPETAKQFNVNAGAIRLRAKRLKIKGIPDARSIVKGTQGRSDELVAANGDLSGHIPGFRARTFEKIDKSIRAFRPKAPKSFRELDSAVKVGERMLGIGEDTGGRAQTIIQINEAVNDHEASIPIEATVIPCDPEPLPNESGQQGSTSPSREPAHQLVDTPPPESNAPKESEPPAIETSRTLNASDAPRRRFVLPGIIES